MIRRRCSRLPLACVRVSAVIVLDDLDRGVSAAVQQTLLDALIRLAKTGPTIMSRRPTGSR